MWIWLNKVIVCHMKNLNFESGDANNNDNNSSEDDED